MGAFGGLTRVFYDYGGEVTARWLRAFSYTRSVVLSALAILAGGVLAVPLIRQYVRSGLRLPADVAPWNHLAVLGLLLFMAGSMTFTFTLALHAAAAYVRRK